MALDAKKLVAAINPKVYCDTSYVEDGVRLNEKVAKILKEQGVRAAAEIAELKKDPYVDIKHTVMGKGAFEKSGIRAPIEQHILVYDAFSQSLEPIYFWILDYVDREIGKMEKLTDNFAASPGSGYFGEMSRRATVLQEEAMKMLGAVNQVLRSILNIIYDLKEFKIRLVQYEDYHSEDERKKKAALLGLKQIWMDRVDFDKRQGSSLKGLAQQFDYVTIIDAFMSADSLEDVSKLDLNERVRRILQQRVPEFLYWIKESERELRKRFEIEKTYLRSQVNTIRLYSRWVRPYLEAAKQLEQNVTPTAELVNSFNTSLFELVALTQGKYDPIADVTRGELPAFFRKLNLRQYHPLTLIEFRFRSIPERTDQQGGYGFRGRVEVVFTSFVLNDDELKLFREIVAEDDFGEVYELIFGATDKSLGELRDDLHDLLGENWSGQAKNEKQELKKEKKPFSFFSMFKEEKKEGEKKDFKKGVPSDTDYEAVIRSQALLKARWDCRKLYDDYKKAHDMPAFPPVL